MDEEKICQNCDYCQYDDLYEEYYCHNKKSFRHTTNLYSKCENPDEYFKGVQEIIMKKTTDAAIILKKELGITGDPYKEYAVEKEKKELRKQMEKERNKYKGR